MNTILNLIYSRVWVYLVIFSQKTVTYCCNVHYYCLKVFYCFNCKKKFVNNQELLELILEAINWHIYMYLWCEYLLGIQSIKLPKVCRSWTESQKLLLNKFFQDNIYPKDNDIAEYARKLGVSVDKVQRWFRGKRFATSSKARKRCTLRNMCQLIWNDTYFPFINCAGSSSQAKAWLQQVHFHRFNALEKEELKKAFKTCPYLTPVLKVMLTKNFNFSLDKLFRWFGRERKKIQPEIQVQKCKSTKRTLSNWNDIGYAL